MGFDTWKTDSPDLVDERDPRAAEAECPICCDGGEGPECSDACRRIGERRRWTRRAVGLRATLKAAIALARRYGVEGDGLLSGRLLAILARIGELREQLRIAQRKAAGR